MNAYSNEPSIPIKSISISNFSPKINKTEKILKRKKKIIFFRFISNLKKTYFYELSWWKKRKCQKIISDWKKLKWKRNSELAGRDKRKKSCTYLAESQLQSWFNSKGRREVQNEFIKVIIFIVSHLTYIIRKKFNTI